MRELVHEGTRGDRISISDSNKNNMNRKKNKPVLSSMDRRRVLKSKGFTEEDVHYASWEDSRYSKGERTMKVKVKSCC
jgi:glycerol-3-phosphate cytidylyltransferase-like family protein